MPCALAALLRSPLPARRACSVLTSSFLSLYSDAYDIFAISIAASMLGIVYHQGGSLTPNQDLSVKGASHCCIHPPPSRLNLPRFSLQLLLPLERSVDSFCSAGWRTRSVGKGWYALPFSLGKPLLEMLTIASAFFSTAWSS